MKCPRCQHENPPQAKFCLECATPFKGASTAAGSYANLKEELESLRRALREALEQQTVTSGILRVISTGPTDLQAVLDAVAENAARICGANDAQIFRVDGEVLRPVAHHGTVPTTTVAREKGVPISRGTVTGRAVVDRQTVHVEDLAAELETEFPGARPYQQQGGFRTILAAPLIREGVPLGTIMIRRLEVRPFTDKQIELLQRAPSWESL